MAATHGRPAASKTTARDHTRQSAGPSRNRLKPAGRHPTYATASPARDSDRSAGRSAPRATRDRVLRHAAEVAVGVVGHEELLALAVDLEPAVGGQELLHGLHGAGPELWVHRMPVEIGVLDHEVAARGDKVRIGGYLLADVGISVVGVERDEHGCVVTDEPPDFVDGLRRGRRAD